MSNLGVWVLGIVCALFFGLLIACVAPVDYHHYNATVIERSFVPSSTSSGVGFSTNGNPVFVSTTSDEQFCVACSLNGQTCIVKVHKQDWAKLKPNTSVRLRIGVNCFGHECGDLKLEGY